MGVSFPFSLAFHFFFSSAVCKASSDLVFFHFFFLGMVLINTFYTMLRTSAHSSSGSLSIRSNPLNLFVTSTVKKQRHYFTNKGPCSQSYGFSSSHVWMWELDYKESRVLKNWCFWTVVLEKTLESPLDSKEIQPVHPKGNKSWIFIERTDIEAETPILWPPGAKNWLIWKDPDVGKDWRQEEKGMTEDEMVEWHHRLNGHEFK